MRTPGRSGLVLLGGIALVGMAIAVVLSRSPLTVAGTDSISQSQFIELKERRPLSNCQPAGRIPAGTTAIQVGAEGLFFSPAVSLRVLEGSRQIAAGQRIAGGVSGPTVTVPVGRFAHAVSGARVCATIGPALEPIRYYGVERHLKTKATNPLQEVALELRYMRPAAKSWWSRISSGAYHLGLGRAPGGTWVAVLLLLLVLGLVALACRTAMEELR